MGSHRDPFSIAPGVAHHRLGGGRKAECCILGCRKNAVYTCCIPVYSGLSSSRAACRGLQLYSCLQRSTVYSSTAVYSIQQSTFPLSSARAGGVNTDGPNSHAYWVPHWLRAYPHLRGIRRPPRCGACSLPKSRCWSPIGSIHPS